MLNVRVKKTMRNYRLNYTTFYLLLGLTLLSCGINKKEASKTTDIPVHTTFVNPALPGDNPDPSIIRVGQIYYASSTTNEWAPYFTIYKSTNLKDWKLVNHV